MVIETPRRGRIDGARTKIAVVAAAWNRYDATTGPMLEAVLRHTGVPFVLIVVDNASTDGTAARTAAVAAADPRVRLVRNGVNAGWAEGSLLGLAAAPSDCTHVCLLNTDVLVAPGWAEGLLRVLSSENPPTAAIPNERPALPATSEFPPGLPGAPAPPTPRVLRYAARVRRRFAGTHAPAPPSGFCLLVDVADAPVLRDYLKAFAAFHAGEADPWRWFEARGVTCRVALDVFVFHARGGSGGYHAYAEPRAI